MQRRLIKMYNNKKNGNKMFCIFVPSLQRTSNLQEFALDWQVAPYYD